MHHMKWIHDDYWLEELLTYIFLCESPRAYVVAAESPMDVKEEVPTFDASYAFKRG